MYRLATCFWVSISTASPQGLSGAPEDVIQDLLKTKIERRHEEDPENSPIRKYKDANFKYFDQAKSNETNFVNNKIEWIKEIIENGK